MTPEVIGFLYDAELSGVFQRTDPDGFMNYGYWYQHTPDSQAASESLMEKLISRISDRRGAILDVACGAGATTHYLTRYWTPERIFAINISERQIEQCRRRLPRCHFSVMNAADITFPDASFESVLCVEAAFHFNTREAFLRQAHRILKPGGVLALTDVLLHEEGHALLPMWLDCNYLPSLAAYEDLTRTVGFSRAELVDITEEGWSSFARHSFARLHDDWLSGSCDFPLLQRRLSTMYRLAAGCRYNLMGFAWK